MPTYDFIGGLGGDDITRRRWRDFRVLLTSQLAGGTCPACQLLGIDSPADVLGAEGGR